VHKALDGGDVVRQVQPEVSSNRASIGRHGPEHSRTSGSGYGALKIREVFLRAD